jgi:hypothetical protein
VPPPRTRVPDFDAFYDDPIEHAWNDPDEWDDETRELAEKVGRLMSTNPDVRDRILAEVDNELAELDNELIEDEQHAIDRGRTMRYYAAGRARETLRVENMKLRPDAKDEYFKALPDRDRTLEAYSQDKTEENRHKNNIASGAFAVAGRPKGTETRAREAEMRKKRPEPE